MSWAALFTSLAGPVVKRALVAIGVGVISYGAVLTAFNAMKDAFLTAYGQISVDLLWMIELAGLHTAAGIILGAMVARLTLQAVSRLGKLQS